MNRVRDEIEAINRDTARIRAIRKEIEAMSIESAELESAHTPAPWIAEKPFAPVPGSDNWQARVRWEANDGHTLCIVIAGGVDILSNNKDGVAANARLIAAAPDLLDALTNLLERSEAIQEDAGEMDPPPFVPGLLARARTAITKATDNS